MLLPILFVLFSETHCKTFTSVQVFWIYIFIFTTLSNQLNLSSFLWGTTHFRIFQDSSTLLWPPNRTLSLIVVPLTSCDNIFISLSRDGVYLLYIGSDCCVAPVHSPEWSMGTSYGVIGYASPHALSHCKITLTLTLTLTSKNCCLKTKRNW